MIIIKCKHGNEKKKKKNKRYQRSKEIQYELETVRMIESNNYRRIVIVVQNAKMYKQSAKKSVERINELFAVASHDDNSCFYKPIFTIEIMLSQQLNLSARHKCMQKTRNNW